jgi:hypothetical protein
LANKYCPLEAGWLAGSVCGNARAAWRQTRITVLRLRAQAMPLAAEEED